MTEEATNTISESIKALENLEASEVQATQKKILEELYAIRENLANAKPSNGGGDTNMLKDLYMFRETLKEEILESRKMQNMLMRRTERVGHLKRNFKRIFEENLKLKKENEQLKKSLKETEQESKEE